MSFFKKAIKAVGKGFSAVTGIGKKQLPDIPIQMLAPNLQFQSGLPPGIQGGSGQLDNPYQIEGIEVSPPKGGSTSNWLDKAINGIDSVGNLISSITGNNPAGSSLGGSLNSALKDATEDVEIQVGLSNKSKIFIAVITGGILIFLLKNKKRRY